MRWTVLAAAVVAAASLAQGATLGYTSSSTVTLTLLSGSTAPVRLAMIATGVAIGANATSLNATGVPSGLVVPATVNLSWANDTSSSALAIRLSAMSLTGNGVSECTLCKLQLACGSTTSDQIVVSNGAIANATGPYQTVAAAGSACSTWSLLSVAQASTLQTHTATLGFDLDVRPSGSSFPNATYYDMSVTWSI
jgi:hypothetical protein